MKKDTVKERKEAQLFVLFGKAVSGKPKRDSIGEGKGIANSTIILKKRGF